MTLDIDFVKEEILLLAVLLLILMHASDVMFSNFVMLVLSF